jgi:hypothetical protein
LSVKSCTCAAFESWALYGAKAQCIADLQAAPAGELLRSGRYYSRLKSDACVACHRNRQAGIREISATSETGYFQSLFGRPFGILALASLPRSAQAASLQLDRTGQRSSLRFRRTPAYQLARKLRRRPITAVVCKTDGVGGVVRAGQAERWRSAARRVIVDARHARLESAKARRPVQGDSSGRQAMPATISFCAVLQWRAR